MKLLDYDPFTGLRTYFEHDPKTGKNTIQYQQDVQHILDANQFEAKALDKTKSWWKIGTIPNNLIMQWSVECGHPPYSKDWQEYSRKKINSPEFRKLNVNNIKL
jgi:hypothetical protein